MRYSPLGAQEVSGWDKMLFPGRKKNLPWAALGSVVSVPPSFALLPKSQIPQVLLLQSTSMTVTVGTQRWENIKTQVLWCVIWVFWQHFALTRVASSRFPFGRCRGLTCGAISFRFEPKHHASYYLCVFCLTHQKSSLESKTRGGILDLERNNPGFKMKNKGLKYQLRFCSFLRPCNGRL